MSQQCDLLFLFNARTKLKDKNVVITQLKNQIAILEEKLKNKCEEVSILHEQLFALSQRVDNLSSKRSTKISRIMISRSNNSVSIMDDDLISQSFTNSQNRNEENGCSQLFYENIENIENSEGISTISKKIENIQKLTATSPLNTGHNLINTRTSFAKPFLNTKIYKYNDEFSFDDSKLILNNLNDEICSLPISSNDDKTKNFNCSDFTSSQNSNYDLSFIGYNKTHNQICSKKSVSNHKKTNSLTFQKDLKNFPINYRQNNNLESTCLCKHFINEINQHLLLLTNKFTDDYFKFNNNLKITLSEIELFNNTIDLKSQPFNNHFFDNVHNFDWINYSNYQNQKSLLFLKYGYQSELVKISEDYLYSIQNLNKKFQKFYKT